MTVGDDQLRTGAEDVVSYNHIEYKAQELLISAHLQELANIQSQALTHISDSISSGLDLGSYI